VRLLNASFGRRRASKANLAPDNKKWVGAAGTQSSTLKEVQKIPFKEKPYGI
jgi:hypothetical protein